MAVEYSQLVLSTSSRLLIICFICLVCWVLSPTCCVLGLQCPRCRVNLPLLKVYWCHSGRTTAHFPLLTAPRGIKEFHNQSEVGCSFSLSCEYGCQRWESSDWICSVFWHQLLADGVQWSAKILISGRNSPLLTLLLELHLLIQVNCRFLLTVSSVESSYFSRALPRSAESL